MSLIYWIILYLLFVNLAALILFKRDKSLARKGKKRISEKTLFLSAILGGGFGGILGMYLFSHKTKKTAFILGLPLIAIINMVIVILIVKKAAI